MPEASSEYSTVVEDILKLVWSAEEAGRDGVKPKDIGEHMAWSPRRRPRTCSASPGKAS